MQLAESNNSTEMVIHASIHSCLKFIFSKNILLSDMQKTTRGKTSKRKQGYKVLKSKIMAFIACPHCKVVIRYDRIQLNEKQLCMACLRSFVIEGVLRKLR